MFRWGDAFWLVGTAAVPLMALFMIWSRRRSRRALASIGDSQLIAQLTATVRENMRRIGQVLLLAATASIVLALARPQFGTRVEIVRTVGQDIVVAMDLSSSMLAEDVTPNRLERARLSILRLMTRLGGDRIALVAFAGDAYVQSPLTTDYTAAATFLNAMTPAMMPVQGTDLGAALRVSLDALDGGAREARAILIITDGEDHEEALEVEAARAVAAGVPVHTVGIGSPEGVPVPEFDDRGQRVGFLREEDGTIATTGLDETTLRSLAERTGGSYARVSPGTAGLDRLIDELTDAEGEELDARENTSFVEQYQIFLGLALILLACEWFLPTRRSR